MTKAAIKIQSAWRAFIVFSSCVSDLESPPCIGRMSFSHLSFPLPSQLILRYENQAATTIQSYWRRYYQCTNYSIIYYEVSELELHARFD